MIMDLARIQRASGNDKPEVSVRGSDYDLVLRAFPQAKRDDLAQHVDLYGVKIKRHHGL